jgi:Domain of unknown function (DUF4397)
MSKLRFVLALAIAFVMVIGSFGVSQAAGRTGFIRVIHASPDAPPVDIYLDGATTPAITNLAFGQATDFINLPTKRYSVQIRAAGAPADSDPVFSSRFNVPFGGSLNIVASGLLGGKGRQAFNLALIPLNRTDTKGKARVQVIHASPDAPAVDVRAGDTVLSANIPFRGFIPRSLNVDPGTYSFQVVPAGSREPVVINLADVQLASDTIYTIVAIGKLAEIRPLVLTTVPVK